MGLRPYITPAADGTYHLPTNWVKHFDPVVFPANVRLVHHDHWTPDGLIDASTFPGATPAEQLQAAIDFAASLPQP